MEPYIKNAEELIEIFTNYIKFKKGRSTIFVTADIRKEILVSEKQGNVVANGKFYKINFTDQSGGVWLASMHKAEDPRLKFLKEKN